MYKKVVIEIEENNAKEFRIKGKLSDFPLLAKMIYEKYGIKK